MMPVASYWLLIASCRLLVAGADAPPPDSQQSPGGIRQAVSGRFEAGFEGAWARGESDLNLNQHLRLSIEPPGHKRLRIRGSLWMHEDLDSDEDKGGVLWGINDTYDSDVRARLLNLYLDIEDVWGDSTLRIGRQRIQEGAAFNRIDGAYFTQRHAGWDWYAFGGVRASIYEDAHNDLALGGGASYRVADYTRLALDLYYGDENRDSRDEVRRGPLTALLGLSYPRRVKKVVDDNLVSFSVWHDFTPNVRLFGRFSLVDGHGDALLLNVLGHIPSWDLTYELAHRRQLSSVGDRVNDLTGYYRIVGEYEEYQNFFAAIHKPLTEKLTLSLEGEFHDARHDDAYTANRDYSRYGGTLSAENLFPGIDATIALENWDVDDGESAWVVTGELEKAWNDVTVTLGADYEQYKERIIAYNPLPFWIERLRVALVPGVFVSNAPLVYLLDTRRVETHENIHSVYAKVKWALKDKQDVTLRVIYEEDDGPESPYWRVRAAYAIRF